MKLWVKSGNEPIEEYDENGKSIHFKDSDGREEGQKGLFFGE